MANENRELQGVEVMEGEEKLHESDVAGVSTELIHKEICPPTEDEYLWMWKVCNLLFVLVLKVYVWPQPELETTRRTFFL